MDSNLVVTGQIAKHYDVYKEIRTVYENPDKRDHYAAVSGTGFSAKHRESNVNNLQEKLIMSEDADIETFGKALIDNTEKRVPLCDGDVIYMCPVRTGDFMHTLGMLSTTSQAPQRSCVRFWENESDRRNPYAGLYKIRTINAYNSSRQISTKVDSDAVSYIKQGEVVHFQLLLSQKFLSAEIGKNADIEKDFVKLGISENGTDISARFSIRTRYNSKSGNVIYYCDQVLISHDISQLEVRVANKTSVYGSSFFEFGVHCRVEVNLGRFVDSEEGDNFFWKIGKYCSKHEEPYGSDKSNMSDKLSVGSCVMIHYPHRNAFLWGSLNSTVFDTFSANLHPEESALFYNKNPEFSLHFDSRMYFKFAFVIEKVSNLQGGNIHPDSLCRLRHLGSNTYLCVEKQNHLMKPSTRLCRQTKVASDADKIQFLLSSLFLLHGLTSEVDKSGVVLLSDTSFLRIVHPTVYFSRSVDLLTYIKAVELLMTGNFSISPNEEFELTMGSARAPKKVEYLPLVCDANCETFHIRPQQVEEHSKATRMRKASAIFSNYTAEYDVLTMRKINCFFLEIYTTVLDQHDVFDNIEADLYRYASLNRNKRLRSYPCGTDTIFEMKAVVDNILSLAGGKLEREVDMSSYQVFDQEDLTRVLQSFTCASRIIDRCFWFLDFPDMLRMDWPQLFLKSEELVDLVTVTKRVILQAGKDNPLVQEYLARSKVTGYRSTRFDPSEHIRGYDNSIKLFRNRGYFAAIAEFLQKDDRDGACLLLEELLLRNARLSKFFVNEAFIEYVVKILRRCGPAASLLRLLASVVSGSQETNVLNAGIILDVLCSAHQNPFYLDNRFMILMETLSNPDSNSPMCVVWNGSSQYDPLADNSDYFFYDPNSLGLNSYTVPMSMELSEYFLRRGVKVEQIEGVAIDELAWNIDPPNLYRFWDDNEPSPSVAWSEVLKKNDGDPMFLKNMSRLESLAQHYFGVINLYKELCKDCERGRQYLERQLSFKAIEQVVNNEKMPLKFRRVFIAMSHNLYIERYPNIKQLYPNFIRTQEDIESVDNLEGALTSGRIDHVDSNVADVSEMKATVTMLGANSESCTLSYRAYLETHHKELMSSSWSIFGRVHDLISSYFFNEKQSDRFSLSGKERVGNMVDSLQFECTCLDIVASLLSYGFYSTFEKLADCVKIAFLMIETANNDTKMLNTYKKESFISRNNKARKENNTYKALRTSNHDDSESHSESGSEFDYDDASMDFSDNFFANGDNINSTANDTTRNSPDVTSNAVKLTTGVGTNGKESPDIGVLLSRLCRQHDTHHAPSRITETIFENQRWSGANYVPNSSLHSVGPYDSENPVLKKIFTIQHPIKDNVSDSTGLPDPVLWVWVDDWEVQMSQTRAIDGKEVACQAEDEAGWFYAFGWAANFYPKQTNFKSYVRRRRWQRTRREVTAKEFFEKEVQAGCSKEALHDACQSRGCIDSNGKIDFSKVLSAISRFSLNNRKTRGNDDPLANDYVTIEKKVKIDTRDPHEIWLEALVKSCLITDMVYDILLNARMTVFLKHFLSTIPMEKSSGKSENVLWYLDDSDKRNVHPTLTRHGKDIFKKLFTDISCSKLITGKNRMGMDQYIRCIINLIMEEHHDLCGSALTVLRRELSEYLNLYHHTGETIRSTPRCWTNYDMILPFSLQMK